MSNHHNGRRYRTDEMLPAEMRLRTAVAKSQYKALKFATAGLTAALSSHAAADTGRRNKDWLYNTGSSDLNIIPEVLVLEGRARQMVRDSWLAKSIVRAYKRNVVGRQIIITPHAKAANGSPDQSLNRAAQHEFHWWARTKEACDIEKKQTFGQMQRLAVSERATVGEHFWVWDYNQPTTASGTVDLSRPCGLSIQRFEPEQLDHRILSYQGREVRGGIELDENGAEIAYHFFTRNPNDYLYRRAFWSIRLPRERVWHYAEQERVLQTRASGPLTPVLQDIRDHHRYRQAKLWRRIMEACIGMIIKKPYPTSAGSPLTFSFQQSDPTGQTQSGMRTADFVPGMVPELLPGEEVEAFTPQPTTGDDEFSDETIRGIGAGAGISYGQIARRSQGSYSSARQDMLEDRKEWEPEQDLLIDDLLRPCYELWFTFAALEGRFDDVTGFDTGDFLSDRTRFVEAEFIPPPQTWIDPQKEADAFETLLKNRLITREEIIAMRGERFWNVVQKIAGERDTIDGLGMTLPEDAPERTELRNVVKAMLAQVLSAPQVMKWVDVKDTLDDVGVSTTDAPQELPVPPARQSAIPPQPGKPAAEPKPAGPAARLQELEAPDYRPCGNPVEKCATCSFAVANHCRVFDFDVNPDYVCDAWKALPVAQGIQSAKTFPPGPLPGQKPIDRNFQPAADETPTP